MCETWGRSLVVTEGTEEGSEKEKGDREEEEDEKVILAAMSSISAPKRQWQADFSVLKASLVYVASARPARAPWLRLCLRRRGREESSMPT